MTSSTRPSRLRQVASGAILSAPLLALLVLAAPIVVATWRAPGVATPDLLVVVAPWCLGLVCGPGFLYAAFTGRRVNELRPRVRLWVSASLVLTILFSLVATVVLGTSYLSASTWLLLTATVAPILAIFVSVRVLRAFFRASPAEGTVAQLNQRYDAEVTRARGGWSAIPARFRLMPVVMVGALILLTVLLQVAPIPWESVLLGRWSVLLPPLAFVGTWGLLYGIYRFFRWRWERRVSAAFLAPDAGTVIDLVATVLPRRGSATPDVDAQLASNRVYNQVLYGETAAARAALDGIDWERRAPAIHAHGLMGEAEIALLCTGDAARGLALARRGLDLGRSTNLFAGWVRARSLFPALIGLGEVLCGEADEGTMARLRTLAKRGMGQATRAVATRGLYVEYDRAGDRAAAQQMRLRLEREMPHCAPLLADADGPPAGAEWARDPGEPSRAVLENAWVAPPASPSSRGGRLAGPRLMRSLLLWALLIILFLTFYQMMGP